jgi:cobalt/nickel transport system permease protein
MLPALPAPQALHAPDGFFATWLAIVAFVVSAGVIALALRKVSAHLDERAVPLMAVMAAFIFAAQMLNFPVAGGTSGHLIGGALAAILLGPWAAVIVVTAVVGVQALMFQDGGLVVLGVNIFNMAIVSSFVAWALFTTVNHGTSPRTLLVSSFIAAFGSVVAAAMVTAVQLSLSGTSPLTVAFPAMTGVHALIGIGEGLITMGAVAFVRQARPDLLRLRPNAPAGGSK